MSTPAAPSSPPAGPGAASSWRGWLGAYLLVSLAWWLTVSMLAARWTVLGLDSILYALPLAVERNPFDLGIPMLGDFESYSHVWGHQWPGGMWVRGVIFKVVPFSHTADVAVLFGFLWLAATGAGATVWRLTGKPWAAFGCALFLLADRIFLASAGSHRLEAIAAACLAIQAYDFCCADGPANPWRRGAAALGTALAPTAHPYAVALGGILVAGEVAYGWSREHRITRRAWTQAGLFALGCLALFGWYALQPEALEQFRRNVALQVGLARHWDTVLMGLTNYRLGIGFVLWGCALAAVFGFWRRTSLATGSPLRRFALRWLFPLLFLAVPVIHTATRCENPDYLALVCLPAAMLVACGAADLEAGWAPSLRWVPKAALAGLVAWFGLVLPYRMATWFKEGRPDLRVELDGVLARIPAGATVYFPPSFWSAALGDSRHHFLHWTFSVVSSMDRRRRYEEQAYATARAGDFLIVDRQMADIPDRFGIVPTFPLTPPDARVWTYRFELVHMFEGALRWGHDYAIYEHQ